MGGKKQARLFAAHVDGAVGTGDIFQIFASLVATVFLAKIAVDRFA
jgi:hypothetical protein